MTWRIHQWDALAGHGSISSPHFGPLPFGAAENPEGVSDFHSGEEVVVEVDRGASGLVVRSVRPVHQRPSLGTELADFAGANGHGGLELLTSADGVLVFWVGSCCSWCSPSAPRVVFRGVTAFVGWDEDDPAFCPSWPLFRLGSRDEIEARGLSVPHGSTAYVILTDGPPVFIVASSVEIVRIHDQGHP